MQTKRKWVLFILVLLVFVLCVSGCLDKQKLKALYLDNPTPTLQEPQSTAGDPGEDTTDESDAGQSSPTQAPSNQDLSMIGGHDLNSQNISVLCSTLTLPFLQSAADALQKTNNTVVEAEAVGNDDAIYAIDNKLADLAFILSDANALQKPANAKILAYDGIALVVSKQSSLTDLTQDELISFFVDSYVAGDDSGAGSSDESAGNGDSESATITADASSGTDESSGTDPVLSMHIVIGDKNVHSRQLVEELFPIRQNVDGLDQLILPDTAIISADDAQVIQAVANDPQAIGIVSIHSDLSTVKTLTLDGKKPDENGYGAKLPLLLYFADSASPKLKTLLDFFNTAQGKSILSAS